MNTSMEFVRNKESSLSITDPCLGWEKSRELIFLLAETA